MICTNMWTNHAYILLNRSFKESKNTYHQCGENLRTFLDAADKKQRLIPTIRANPTIMS
jgi:hypothetical protein